MSSSRMPAYQRQKVKFATNSCSSIYRPHEPSELIDAADVVGSIERYITLWGWADIIRWSAVPSKCFLGCFIA